MKQLVLFLVVIQLPLIGGEIVLKNNQRIKCAGPYEIVGTYLKYKDEEGNLFQIPLKWVDLKRSTVEDPVAVAAEPKKKPTPPGEKPDIDFHALAEERELKPEDAAAISFTDENMDDFKNVGNRVQSGQMPHWRAKSYASLVVSSIKFGNNRLFEQSLKPGLPLEGKIYRKKEIPIHLAIEYGRFAMFKRLIKYGADVDVLDGKGNTPLNATLLIESVSNYGMATLLLNAGADPNLPDYKGYYPLHRAVLKKDTSFLQLLLKNQAWPNVTDKQGNTPLLLAIREIDGQMVTLLLEGGASTQKQGRGGRRPLREAVISRNVPILKMILNQEQDIDHFENDGYNGLMAAVETGNENLVGILLKAGANPTKASPRGTSALKLAVESGQAEMTQILLHASKSTQSLNWIAVESVSKGDVRLARMVFDKGVDVNTVSQKGDPLLVIASRNSNLDIVNLLLNRGADVYKKNSQGLSAYVEAEGPNKVAIQNALRAHFKK